MKRSPVTVTAIESVYFPSPADAEISAEPGATAMMRPVLDTTTVFGSEDSHVMSSARSGFRNAVTDAFSPT